MNKYRCRSCGLVFDEDPVVTPSDDGRYTYDWDPACPYPGCDGVGKRLELRTLERHSNLEMDHEPRNMEEEPYYGVVYSCLEGEELETVFALLRFIVEDRTFSGDGNQTVRDCLHALYGVMLEDMESQAEDLRDRSVQ